MKIITILFILLFNISYSLAETTDTPEILKEYDIEIIIFEDAHARYLNSESWHKNSSDGDNQTSEKSLEQRSGQHADRRVWPAGPWGGAGRQVAGATAHSNGACERWTTLEARIAGPEGQERTRRRPSPDPCDRGATSAAGRGPC